MIFLGTTSLGGETVDAAGSDPVIERCKGSTPFPGTKPEWWNVDTVGSNPAAERREGSSPSLGTKHEWRN